jgi:hypothetical protein
MHGVGTTKNTHAVQSYKRTFLTMFSHGLNNHVKVIIAGMNYALATYQEY